MTLTYQQATTLLDNAETAVNRLQEAITRKSIDKTLKPIETRLQSTVATLFRKQGRDVVRALPPVRKHLIETVESDFNDLFDNAIEDTSADMFTAIERAIESGVVIGGKQLIREFKADLVFGLTNPRAVLYTKDRSAEAITQIDNETKDVIRALIVTAVENGTSYQTLARQIKDRYTQFAIGVPQQHIRSRAELVAITEVGNAYQAGNYAAAQDMTASGIKLQKSWHNVGDKRVSDGCKDNSAAGWIDLDEAFPSGHMTPLRFPGCRCAALYRRKQ